MMVRIPLRGPFLNGAMMAKVIQFRRNESFDQIIEEKFKTDRFFFGVVTEDDEGNERYHTYISPGLENRDSAFLLDILRSRHDQTFNDVVTWEDLQ